MDYIDNTEFFSDMGIPKISDSKAKEYAGREDLDEIRDEDSYEEYIGEIKATIAGYRRELASILMQREAECGVYLRGDFEDAVKTTEIQLAEAREYTRHEDLRADAETATIDLINSLAKGTDHYTDRIILLATKIDEKIKELEYAPEKKPAAYKKPKAACMADLERENIKVFGDLTGEDYALMAGITTEDRNKWMESLVAEFDRR